MPNEFEFQLWNGQRVYTGNIKPETKPLGNFQEYPAGDLFNLNEVKTILSNQRRQSARSIYGSDWILNQGRRSSCNAYMAGGMLMRARDRKGLERVDLAPEWGYMNINDGRDRGSMLDDGMKWLAEHGLPRKGTVPYEAFDLDELNMEQRRYAAQEAKEYRYFEAYELPSNSAESLWMAIVSAVLRNEQVGIAVHVGRNFLNTKNNGYAVCGFDRGPGNHAVGIDDAVVSSRRPVSRPSDIYLDMYNSWGPTWGDNGRGLLTIDHIREPMKYHCFYAVRSATTDSESKPPTLIA